VSNERIQKRFAALATSGRGALLPYFTSGFPDADGTIDLIRAADALGVPVVEIGIPYSDSIADGPVIQSSFNYVLDHGFRLADTFDLVERVRSEVSCALVAMVSFSIVQRVGIEAFMRRCEGVGFDGVILPDVPVEESQEAVETAQRAGLCHIGLVAPTTPPERRTEIALRSTGFIYQIAVSGLTGERSELPSDLADDVAELRRVSSLPVCVGFGVSTTEQVRAICRFADGAIVGSALVRRIADGLREKRSGNAIVANVTKLLEQLTAGTHNGERKRRP